MNGITTAILIIILVILLVVLWRIFKPYFVRYDTTLAFTGGLGSGKTLSTVKTAVILLRKNRFFKYYCYNFFIKIGNFFRKGWNKQKHRYNLRHLKDHKQKLIKAYWPKREKPMLYSNIPIHFKKHIFSSKREWAKMLKAPHVLCLTKMEEYSVIVIDELPQFINQFNWNEELIQKNVNEFITFFRHYIGGYLLVNAQSIDDVVVQIRRKLNNAIWCFDFKKWLFGLFYTIRMCDIMLGDQITSTTSTFIEDNTRLHFGLFPPRKTYNSRCYKPRYKNILKDAQNNERHKKLTTTKVLRLQKYTSPLDDKTTNAEKEAMWEKGSKIWEN